jgi:hypothetical protein
MLKVLLIFVSYKKKIQELLWIFIKKNIIQLFNYETWQTSSSFMYSSMLS